MTVLADFRPLQGTIAQAESWTHYLNTRRDVLDDRRPDEIAASLENVVWAGVHLGELLPHTWLVTFDNLFRAGHGSWTSVKEFDSIRQEVRRLFFTTREALELFRRVAENFPAVTGRGSTGIDRLLRAIEAARELEEGVFRDWPSFADPLPQAEETRPVDESLAEALGVSVEEARQRLEARRRELNAQRE